MMILRIARWLWQYRPVRGWRYDRALVVAEDLRAAARRLAIEHVKREARLKRRLDDLLDKCSHIEWSRQEPGGHYIMTWRVSAELCGVAGGFDREDMAMIGEYFGRRVEADIASARFVTTAKKAERRDDRRMIERYRAHNCIGPFPEGPGEG